MAPPEYTADMDLDADLIFEIASGRLPEAGVDCVMIGGHAVNHYGVSRATQDIDFMITAEDEDKVRHVMSAAGFTNTAVHETVVFFNRPGSPLRVVLLKVTRETMDKLLANAVAVEYFGGHSVWVPQLKDLLAMKLFALASGGSDREEKDFPDIVNLVIENRLDVEADLAPLCREFGTDKILSRLSARVRELHRD